MMTPLCSLYCPRSPSLLPSREVHMLSSFRPPRRAQTRYRYRYKLPSPVATYCPCKGCNPDKEEPEIEPSSAFAVASRAFTLAVAAGPLFSGHLASCSGPCPSKLVCMVTTGLCLLSLSRGTSVPFICSEKLADTCIKRDETVVETTNRPSGNQKRDAECVQQMRFEPWPSVAAEARLTSYGKSRSRSTMYSGTTPSTA